jgi:photosystem II stability/assembly factor-like uncharacterized protein
MRVANPDGSGIHDFSDTSSPSGFGVDAIAVDPTNVAVVYLVFTTAHSCDLQCPTGIVELYKSTDGGGNFFPLGLRAASITGDANGPNRYHGDRLIVDPSNSQVLYYGSEKQGLLRSLDGGRTWIAYTPAAGLPNNIEFINIQVARHSGTTNVAGNTVTKTAYAISVHNRNDTGGDVYQSTDGGQTWADISTGVGDGASGQRLAMQALASSIDAADNLYVVENAATNGNRRAYWRYAASSWQRFSVEDAIGQPLNSVAVDPRNPKRLYILGIDTSMSRSDDGGVTWTSLGEPLFANTFAWLPQKVGMNGGDWHSNGGLHFDARGNLWTPTGQEGALTVSSTEAASATADHPPRWSIVSSGVEELVSQDIFIPRGGGDTIIATAADTTGFVIPNPDDFSAKQIPLQQEVIALGGSVDAAPDVPNYVAVTSSNVYTNGPNYSGYSSDRGVSWHRFGAALQFHCAPQKQCDVQAGQIAVGRRGPRKLGQDHIVLLPPNNLAPESSVDGGATWHVTMSFPLLPDGMTLDTLSGAYVGSVNPFLHQRLLRADPFTADRFYLKFTHAPFPLYVSTDSGQTWTGQPKANLPDGAWHGQLAVNFMVQNDLWYADGWEASSQHGVFHSTDGGASFTQLPAISHALQIAIGAASPQHGGAPYTVYFYGQLAADPAWGVFQSTDAGASWNRIAYYPVGIYDVPVALAASPDIFGKVYVGLGGNSFVYGQLKAPAPGAKTIGNPSARRSF